MNGLLAVVNPSPRRRRRKASGKRHRSAAQRAATRKMLAANRARRGGSHRRRAVKHAIVHVNPTHRRRRRASAARSVRRYRRNPVGGSPMRANLATVQRSLGNAVSGAAGAIVTDLAMAQAAAFVPATMASRYDAAGGINFGYYGIKAGLAILLGVAGSKFLPGKLRALAVRGAEGSLTVQAYELGRAMIPASWTLGYFNPGRMAGLGAYVEGPKRSGMGAYVGPSATLSQPMSAYVGEPRVGEGGVR